MKWKGWDWFEWERKGRNGIKKGGEIVTKKDVLIKELKKIKAKNKYHILMPEDVVEAATDKKSVLHNLFTWDDTSAAKEYRLWQARQLVAKVRIKIEDDGTEKIYYHCKVSINNERVEGYVDKKDFNDKDIYFAVLKEAVVSLRYWQKKYHELKELENVIDENKLNIIEKEVKAQ